MYDRRAKAEAWQAAAGAAAATAATAAAAAATVLKGGEALPHTPTLTLTLEHTAVRTCGALRVKGLRMPRCGTGKFEIATAGEGPTQAPTDWQSEANTLAH